MLLFAVFQETVSLHLIKIRLNLVFPFLLACIYFFITKDMWECAQDL